MKILNYIVAGFLLIILNSCEKVINVDLKNSEPRLVIEGSVSDAGTPATVTISKSSVFSTVGNYPKVSGAVVKITDNLGNVFNLTETTPGTYTNAALVGVIGRTYNMSVVTAGITYTATSKIPRQMNFDTLIIKTLAATPGNPASKVASAFYEDSVGFGDNVQLVQTVNGIRDRNMYIADDFYSDGGYDPFDMVNPNIKLKTGDLVKVEMRFIDKPVFKYLQGIENLLDGNTIPENPRSNISGNVLGFFSAYNSQTRTVRVP